MDCRWRGLRYTRAEYRYSMSCREYATPSGPWTTSMWSVSYSDRNASRFLNKDLSTPTVSVKNPRVPFSDCLQGPL